MELFLVFIFYTYNNVETHHLKLNIFLQMKNYSLNFKSDKFDIDFVDKKNQKLYELQENTNYLFIYVAITKDTKELLKIIYPKKSFLKELSKIKQKLIVEFLILSIISFIISILFSVYSLYPLQKSYTILHEFMKDIIHDINTPISSIKLNLNLFDKKNDEIYSIEQSINTLEMLHKNLDNFLNDTKLHYQNYNVKDILYSQIEFFKNLYDWLDWQLDIKDDIIRTDKYLLERVLYNLLNNSCKYNISKGFVKIKYTNRTIIISNSSYGIKNPSKVFSRFYKENNRGLGIGLHIVSKILTQLNYKYNLQINKNNIVTVTITLQ